MDLTFLKDKKNKYIVITLMILLVIVMVLPTSTNNQAQKETSSVVQSKETDLEQRLSNVLSSMEGVGEVEVMITLEEQENTIFGTSEDTGKVCGVVVVAEGAGNAIVETRILNAVKALFSIEAHKISIIKRAMQEENK